MFWRAWCFTMAAPLGALAATALFHPPTPLRLLATVLLSGVLLTILVSAVALSRRGRTSSGARLAAACSAGCVALPAFGGVILGWAPGAWWWLGFSAALLAGALVWGVRGRAEVGVRGVVAVALLCTLGGAVASVVLSGMTAAWGAQKPRPAEGQAELVYAYDARIPTRALPFCAQVAREIRVLLDRGAHPRLSGDGTKLWFDAEVDGGTRQVERLDRGSGEASCWTCGQPGNNRRPAPSPGGSWIVFDSDRDATLFDPTNTEIYRMSAQGDPSRSRARRLTSSPGPDDHAIFGPGPGVVVWSKRQGGRYFVASASILSGHGAVALHEPAMVVPAGAGWAAPLAWSPDARSLLVVRGNPLRPLAPVIIDPATGDERVLRTEVPAGASVGFTADGGWLALASTQTDHLGGSLPASLGFLLGPLVALFGPDAPAFRGTAIATGRPRQDLEWVDLGVDADWGEPTGAALSPDGDRLVLGQRRRVEDRVEERLLEIPLVCSEDAPPS